MTTTPTTLTLSAFLAAMLDEDEAVARAAAAEDGGRWRTGHWSYGEMAELDEPFWDDNHSPGISGFVGDDDPNEHTIVYDEGRPSQDQAVHIARHDPARVLADVEAKRAILHSRTHAPIQFVRDEASGLTDALYGNMISTGEDDTICRLLAQPYASHPDFDPAWRP